MVDRFEFKDRERNRHYAIVFEELGPSIYDFIKQNDYRGFPISMIRDFAKQILNALVALHQIGLTHTDLKPENILLVKSGKSVEENPDNFPI